MHVFTYNNKCINSLYRPTNRKQNRVIFGYDRNTQQRLRIVCNLNKINHKKNNILSSEKQIINKSNYVDNGLFVFTTLVFSSVMVLSTCIVMILTARETNMEANSLQEKYDKLYEEVKHLEEKSMEDEMMINAIVGEIVELKSIGII